VLFGDLIPVLFYLLINIGFLIKNYKYEKFIQVIGFALNGAIQCFAQEAHFKIHTAFTILVITAGFFFKISFTEWLVILICTGAVLAAELLNTAIEELCNIVHKEQHPGIKRIKDMAAAAVFITAVAAAVSGTIIFLPKIILFIKSIIE
jgi:diacylglycerol kinase